MNLMMKKGQPQRTHNTAHTSNATPAKAVISSGSKASTLTVAVEVGKSRKRKLVELNLSPFVANANTARIFGQGSFGELDLGESISVMGERVGRIKDGDLSDVEATLTAQAATLDAVFNELARRAALNMGEHLHVTETYMRLAFKAQAQCRSTLETLAEVKYPKAATFVRQQNVAYQQQVNNGGLANENLKAGTRARARAHGKSLDCENELLDEKHGEWLDTRTKGASSETDSQLEAMGASHGTKDNTGESPLES
jgi:hypothetical protein